MKKILIAVTIFLLMINLLLAGCSNQSPPTQNNGQNTPDNNPVITPDSPKTVGVSIVGFRFVPANIEISRGDTVVWTNEDDAPHTVTSQGFFDSGNMNKGQAYSRTFNDAGTFDYICTYHPAMLGKVVVK